MGTGGRRPWQRGLAWVTGSLALLLLGAAGLPPQSAAIAPAAARPLDLAVVAPVMDCAALRGVDPSAAVGAPTVISSAETVDDGRSPAVCDLKVVVDDYARFELRLPIRTWTQRMLFGGGPGAQAATEVDLGQFATVSWEDLGRRPNEDVFAGNLRSQVLAGYKGMHLQVIAAKSLIGTYYGQGPRFSYWNACSNPGREGMIEAERFPQDFDGIGAGCPPIMTTLNNGMFQAWNVLANAGPDGAAILTEDKLPILHAAVLRQCDAADGLKDGIVSDPYACRPQLAELLCKPGADPGGCLSAAQILVAEELYRGPHDGKGVKLAPSGVLPGSELAWTAVSVPGARFGGPAEARIATTRAIRAHYSVPALPADWKLAQLRFDQATFKATTELNYLHDATDPDLSGYAKAGHKLILWQNLGDTNVLPTQTVLYYQALQKFMGAKEVDGFVRFYVLPGVYHCGGGDGPVISRLLGPLMAWVERGVAPGALAGVHVPRKPGAPPFGPRPGEAAPAPDLTRPIYPYPYLARYTGKGDVRDAANFVQGRAAPMPASLGDWFGSYLYRPDHLEWCTATPTALDCHARDGG